MRLGPDRAQQRAMHRDVVGANLARNWVVERYRADQEVRRQAAFILSLVRLVHGPSPAERRVHEDVAVISALGWCSGCVPSKKEKDTLVKRAFAIEVDLLAYGEQACAVAVACSILRLWAGHQRWKVEPKLPHSFEDLRWLWNREKHLVLSWWSKCSKEALASGIETGALAIKNHRESLRGDRLGERVGMPRFTSIHDGRGYAVTTGTFGLVDPRHVQIPKVPGLVKLAEDLSELASRIKAGTARLHRLTVSERPDGTYECALGLAVKGESLPTPTYIPRGIDLGCKTALMPSRGKSLDLARSPRRTRRAPMFANGSGVAKALSVSARTTMVARLLERCGSGAASAEWTRSKHPGSLATEALTKAQAWCKEHDPEHPYRALKMLLKDDSALDDIAVIDHRVRGGQVEARVARRGRRCGRTRQRDVERDEIHRLGYSPTRKARLADKRSKERARRRLRREREQAESSRLGRSSYARGPALPRQRTLDRLDRRIRRQSQSLARKREHAQKQRGLVNNEAGSAGVLAVLKVVFAALHGITLRGDIPRSRRYVETKRRLAANHARLARARKDGIHKATTREARRSSVIVVEGMNAKRLMANGGRHKRGLDRSLAHRAFGEVRRELSYKLPRRGGVCLIAPWWYPSTKRCSRCGRVVDAISLSERTFRCPHCHLAIDRDRNAAKNLEQAAPFLLLMGALVALGLIDSKVLHKQFYEVSGRVVPRTKNGRGGGSSAPTIVGGAQAPGEAPTEGPPALTTDRERCKPSPDLHREVA